MKTFGIYFEGLTDFVARQQPIGNEMANSIVTLNHQVFACYVDWFSVNISHN